MLLIVPVHCTLNPRFVQNSKMNPLLSIVMFVASNICTKNNNDNNTINLLCKHKNQIMKK